MCINQKIKVQPCGSMYAVHDGSQAIIFEKKQDAELVAKSMNKILSREGTCKIIDIHENPECYNSFFDGENYVIRCDNRLYNSIEEYQSLHERS